MIQSTPASAAARVEPAPREWMRDAQIAPVRLADHGGDLVLGEHLQFAGAAVRHLDEVDAVLALAGAPR